MRGAASTSVTVVPNRANAWASSAPIAPPPMTTIDAGRSAVASTSRLVQNGVSARPSTGGAAGEVPVLSTTPREATYRVPLTSTTPVSTSRPWPRTKRTPACSRRSTATVSSQSSVASSRIRACTSAPVGGDLRGAGRVPTRRASASRFAARIAIFEGMQPVVGALAPDQALVDADDDQAGLRGLGGEVLATGPEADDDEVHGDIGAHPPIQHAGAPAAPRTPRHRVGPGRHPPAAREERRTGHPFVERFGAPLAATYS